MLKHEIAGFLEIILSLMTGGIVKADDKVRLAGQKQPLLDFFPGGQKVA